MSQTAPTDKPAETQAENPLDEAITDADNLTLDRVLRAAPEQLTPADFTALVDALRRDRARFVHAEETKADKEAD